MLSKKSVSYLSSFVGRRVNSFTVLGIIDRKQEGKSRRSLRLTCKCDCGDVRDYLPYEITSEKRQTCGCKGNPLSKTKDISFMGTKRPSKTQLYHIWQSMKQRCCNPKNCNYHKYGGRGISIAEEWRADFCAFAKWAMENGYSSQKNSNGMNYLTIDRIDVNGDYSPSNCRWISNEMQQLNKRTSFMVVYRGETKSLMHWCKELHLSYPAMRKRFMSKKDWTVDKIFETPVKSRKKN